MLAPRWSQACAAAAPAAVHTQTTPHYWLLDSSQWHPMRVLQLHLTLCAVPVYVGNALVPPLTLPRSFSLCALVAAPHVRRRTPLLSRPCAECSNVCLRRARATRRRPHSFARRARASQFARLGSSATAK